MSPEDEADAAARRAVRARRKQMMLSLGETLQLLEIMGHWWTARRLRTIYSALEGELWELVETPEELRTPTVDQVAAAKLKLAIATKEGKPVEAWVRDVAAGLPPRKH